jgi:Mrp family chromosome partitioning ATPase
VRTGGIGQLRVEPTVFGAVRRYSVMVVAISLMTAAVAVGYTLQQTELYRATATVSVPQPLLSEGQASEQYLDSQVLLLQSQNAAERAVRIANGSLAEPTLAVDDFSGDGKSVEITPPEGAQPGSYGATMIAVSFTWPDAQVAQVGANALVQAFDDVRSASIAAEGEATVASIQRAIGDARTQGQRTDLLNQRTQTLVSQQIDLARHPTVAWAALPEIPVNGNAKRAAALGLAVGAVLGAALAFARASHHRRFESSLDPATLYAAPLLGEIPAEGAETALALGTAGPRALAMTAHPGAGVAEAYRFAAGSLERICAARRRRLSVVFVSTGSGGGTSVVAANVAVAVAESGTRVLAVDAADGLLSSLLLPESPSSDGLQQVLSGRRTATECIQASPLHEGLAVLASGPQALGRVTGTAYSERVEEALVEATMTFGLVLVDRPGLLRVADAIGVVDAADAAIVVIGPDEPVQDHLDMMNRLDLVGSEVLGYVYRQAPTASHRIRCLRGRLSRKPARSASPMTGATSTEKEHTYTSTVTAMNGGRSVTDPPPMPWARP